eukprot:jgi/Mesvir1/7173/Mv21142-RA.1
MQDCPAGLSPFFLPAGRPQVKNDPGPEFNKRVVDAVAALAPQVQLVSVCTDGVAYESEFIVPGLIKFLQGESPTLYFLDCNHTVKALRGQICYMGVASAWWALCQSCPRCSRLPTSSPNSSGFPMMPPM